jgi:hypothetical protein
MHVCMSHVQHQDHIISAITHTPCEESTPRPGPTHRTPFTKVSLPCPSGPEVKCLICLPTYLYQIIHSRTRTTRTMREEEEEEEEEGLLTNNE